MVIPPLHLTRLTAATLKTALDSWLPLPIGTRPASSASCSTLCKIETETDSKTDRIKPEVVRSQLADEALFNLTVLVGDGAPSNNVLKKAEVVACLR